MSEALRYTVRMLGAFVPCLDINGVCHVVRDSLESGIIPVIEIDTPEVPTAGEYESLKRGWHAFAQPAVIDDAARQEFAHLAPTELADLFKSWVFRSIDGVQVDFMQQDKPHACFTAQQIGDLWAIINNKEGKVDVSTEPEEK